MLFHEGLRLFNGALRSGVSTPLQGRLASSLQPLSRVHLADLGQTKGEVGVAGGHGIQSLAGGSLNLHADSFQRGGSKGHWLDVMVSGTRPGQARLRQSVTPEIDFKFTLRLD